MTLTKAAALVDPAARLDRERIRAETAIRGAVDGWIDRILRAAPEATVISWIISGRIDRLVEIGRLSAQIVAQAVEAAYLSSAQSTVAALRDLGIVLPWSAADSASQIRVLRASVVEALSGGLADTLQQILDRSPNASPHTTARWIRRSLGLTPQLERALASYRDSISARSATALDRALRDPDLDEEVLRVALGGSPTPGHQARMVRSYAERLRAYRTRTFGLSSGVRAVQSAAGDVYSQGWLSGGFGIGGRVVQVWKTRRDPKVRDSHETMEGQVRDIGQPFVSGAGVELAHPGDPSAPLSETARCRCSVERRVVAEA